MPRQSVRSLNSVAVIDQCAVDSHCRGGSVCSCGYADAGVSFANFSGKPYDDGDGWVDGAEAERVIS